MAIVVLCFVVFWSLCTSRCGCSLALSPCSHLADAGIPARVHLDFDPVGADSSRPGRTQPISLRTVSLAHAAPGIQGKLVARSLAIAIASLATLCILAYSSRSPASY